MITIPLYVFLLVYFVFLAIVATFFIINLYHIFASASFTLISFIMTVFIAFTLGLIIYVTALLLTDIDWTAAVTLFNQEWFGDLFAPKL